MIRALSLAAAALVVAACRPSPDPSIPMARETSPVVEPLEIADEPELPALPSPDPLPLEVRAPGSMMLTVAAQVDAVSEGLVRSSGDGAWSWALTLSDCAYREFEPQAVASGGERCATFAQARFEERTQTSLRVPAGTHHVTVSNEGPASVGGLWIREEDDASETAVTAGGAARGEEVVYSFELTPGRYRLSCPLTPTPDYLLVVEGE